MTQPHLPRRDVFRGIGAGAAALGTGGLVAAGSKGLKGSGTSTGDTLKIGYASPQTGALASFAPADNYIVKDSRSSSTRVGCAATTSPSAPGSSPRCTGW